MAKHESDKLKCTPLSSLRTALNSVRKELNRIEERQREFERMYNKAKANDRAKEATDVSGDDTQSTGAQDGRVAGGQTDTGDTPKSDSVDSPVTQG